MRELERPNRNIDMKTVRTVAELRRAVADARAARRSIGLVPTMGSLHEGHLSLVRRAAAECDFVVVSLFVNPAQFGPGEDFERYPRDEAAMPRLAAAAGRRSAVRARRRGGVSRRLRHGRRGRRPDGRAVRRARAAAARGHFRGVATVVAKLLNMCAPDVAYFGQKDYQQSLVIRRLVRDLDIPVRIEVCPTVRDADGLALSSRNAYLAAAERERALALNRALRAGERVAADGGGRDESLAAAHAELDAAGDRARVPRDPVAPTTSPARRGGRGERGRARDRGAGRPRPADRQHLDEASGPQPRAGGGRLDKKDGECRDTCSSRRSTARP